MPIPVTIVTGFLGAGKTTLLNRILHADHGVSLAVLVNDFGSINIDSQLVVDVAIDDANLIKLSNGCICCTIQGDLVQAIHGLLEKDAMPDGIVIETSGVTDPIDVVLLLRTIEQIKIDRVITVIDSAHLLDMTGDTRILAMNQIGTADLIVLNKIDLVDKIQLQRVRDFVTQIKSNSQLLEAVQADIPEALMLSAGRFDPLNLPITTGLAVHTHASDTPHHDHTHDSRHILHFVTWSWQHTETLTLNALKRFLKRLPEGIYRAKGIFFIEGHDEALLVQVVSKRLDMTWIVPTWGVLPRSQFVVIAEDNALEADVLQQSLDACLVSHKPNTLWARMADRLTWR